MTTPRQDIERYAAQADIIRRAAEGLSNDQLDAFPIPGTWSVRQILVHLLESDLAATHRMRRIAAEDKPLIIAYDESALARELGYEHDDLAVVGDLFALNRRFTAAWLRRLPDPAFDRVGVHNHNGFVSLAAMIAMYVRHVDGHMTHLRRKRELLGSPLGW